MPPSVIFAGGPRVSLRRRHALRWCLSVVASRRQRLWPAAGAKLSWSAAADTDAQSVARTAQSDAVGNSCSARPLRRASHAYAGRAPIGLAQTRQIEVRGDPGAAWQWSKHRFTQAPEPSSARSSPRRRQTAPRRADMRGDDAHHIASTTVGAANRIGLVGPPPLHAIDAAPPTTMRGGWSTPSTRTTETQVTAPRSAPRRRSGSAPFARACACRTCARPGPASRPGSAPKCPRHSLWPASDFWRTADSPATNGPSRRSGNTSLGF